MIDLGLGGCHLNKKEVFQSAWDNGIRFFDSGFGYSGIGVNDNFIGEFIQDKDRKEIKICNKLPMFDKLYIETFGKSHFDMDEKELEFAIRQILDIQLTRCKTTYFDIYMFHAVYDEQYSPGFNLKKYTDEYKRMYKVLAKLKEEGKIKEIGFSIHTTYENLYYFLNEMHSTFGDDCMKYAMVSYNILNDMGRPSRLAELHNVNVWKAPGLEGLKLLKSKGYYIIDMMPTESGRIGIISMAPDWFDWAYRFIRETKEVDMVLLGTSSVKHLQQGIDIFKEKDLENIPNMRVIDSGVKHCHD